MENEKNTTKNEAVVGKKKNKPAIVIILILLITAAIVSVYFLYFNDGNSQLKDKKEVQKTNQYSAYRLSGNSLEDFDLYFLQLENERTNKIYSPLSIKYALEMLEEGANF